MNTLVPVIPDNAPFTPAQKAWLNGFLAGMLSRGPAQGTSSPAPLALKPLRILFASQTGTAERLAKKASKLAGKRGFAPVLADIAQTSLESLKPDAPLLLVTSTYGDGEPPDSAKPLHSALAGLSGTPFSGLGFSVCALGDSKYAKFCQAGKDFDAQLERLGAKRLAERVDCDVGQDDKFTQWLEAALSSLGKDTPAAAVEDAGEEDEGPHSVEAGLLAVNRLSGPGSAKEVNHIVFAAKDPSLAYTAGDALSVMPTNAPDLVEELLRLLRCDGEEAVPALRGECSLRKALSAERDLGKPGADLLKLLGLDAAQPTPLQLVDALLAAVKIPSPKELISALRPLQPRLYSISSSPAAHPGEIHLTVGAVRYEAGGRPRAGVCSTFLAERALSAGHVRIALHANNGFRLPTDGKTPVLMIGPGTGIAPFRGFIHERKATGASGPNWLFFGDQREADDFLYRDEMLALRDSGFLRLSLAWSREQKEKVYVQTRMLEQAAELWQWLEQGAYVYVCGDASRMAKDVDAALHRVIESAGSRTPEDAIAYVNALKSARRYQRDVY